MMHATGYSAPSSAEHSLNNSSNTDTSGIEVVEPPANEGGSTRTSCARSNGAGGDHYSIEGEYGPQFKQFRTALNCLVYRKTTPSCFGSRQTRNGKEATGTCTSRPGSRRRRTRRSPSNVAAETRPALGHGRTQERPCRNFSYNTCTTAKNAYQRKFRRWTP